MQTNIFSEAWIPSAMMLGSSPGNETAPRHPHHPQTSTRKPLSEQLRRKRRDASSTPNHTYTPGATKEQPNMLSWACSLQSITKSCTQMTQTCGPPRLQILSGQMARLSGDCRLLLRILPLRDPRRVPTYVDLLARYFGVTFQGCSLVESIP
jgi:hypothetical protein